ncbi:hypothetical protein C4565_07250 [Candidatus Parcubacteria bacterium]|nr:MAG: hypothetical protein C4565_07250 [Candidatus Parcubacteria bacterium]
MSNLEYAVKKYAVEHYGDLIVPDEPNYDENTKIWKVQLRSTYPRIIEDEKSKEVVVRFLDLQNLGIIKINDNLQVVEATSNEKCEHQLSTRIDLWKHQAEEIVVNASANVFAEIAESIHVLNPLWLVLGEITRLDKEKIKILEKEIDEQRRSGKLKQYLELLAELHIVKKIGDDYTYGNVYVALEEMEKDSRKRKIALLSHVIKSKYSTLRQVFGITQLEPYVHLANTYYWPSLDAEKLIHTTRSRLYEQYQDYYGKVHSWDFDSRISELTDHGAFQKENGYLIGNKDQFDKMLELKQTVLLNP